MIHDLTPEHTKMLAAVFGLIGLGIILWVALGAKLDTEDARRAERAGEL